MLNLHLPFRLAEAGDANRPDLPAPVQSGRSVVAEEGGRVLAVLDGAASGESWRVAKLAVVDSRIDDLGRRILAVADALAADDGLASVVLDGNALGGSWSKLLDEEGFRPTAETGWLARPVVPQG